MIRRRWGLIVSLVLVVGVTGGALLLAVRTRTVEKPETSTATKVARKATAAEKNPALKVEGAVLEERGPDKQLKWRVTAGGELQYDKDGGVVLGRNVKFVILHQADTPATVLAPRFTADYNARRLTFEDGVTGVLEKSAGKFSVSRLVYEFDTGKLIGTGGARFQRGAYTARAEQLVVDTRGRKIRLSGGVRFAQGG